MPQSRILQKREHHGLPWLSMGQKLKNCSQLSTLSWKSLRLERMTITCKPRLLHAKRLSRTRWIMRWPARGSRVLLVSNGVWKYEFPTDPFERHPYTAIMQDALYEIAVWNATSRWWDCNAKWRGCSAKKWILMAGCNGTPKRRRSATISLSQFMGCLNTTLTGGDAEAQSNPHSFQDANTRG